MKKSDDASGCYEVVLRHIERSFGENGELLNQSLSPALRKRYQDLVDKLLSRQPLTYEEEMELDALNKVIFA